jgi:hypothetical protein
VKSSQASTGWITDPDIPFDDLRKAQLEGIWIDEGADGTTADSFALTDGNFYVWAYRHPEMGHATFSVWAEAKNEPGASAIRDAISNAFDVAWFNEHDPEFFEENPDSEGSMTVHSGKPPWVSDALRRLASIIDNSDRPNPAVIRLGARMILRAMEESPPTLRSPQTIKPGIEDVDWDWYLGAFGDVKEMVEEAKEKGPDDEGYMADSIKGFADSLKDLADRLESSPGKPVQEGEGQAAGKLTVPAFY